MKRLFLILLSFFVMTFCLYAEKFSYSVNVQNEEGPGYDISVTYPVFGGKLKAVDQKIAELEELDVAYLKRECTLNVLMTVTFWTDWAQADSDFKKKFEALTGGKDFEFPEQSMQEYKKWLMSAKGEAAIKLCKQKLNEHGQEIPYAFSYYLNYSVFVDGDLLSVYLDCVDYTSGGNGNHQVIKTVNYDMKKKKFVSLEDVTGLSTRQLAALCAESLAEDYDADKGRAMKERVNRGDFPLFVRRRGTIIVYFNPYEIASGAEGLLTAYIPEWEIKNLKQ